MRPSRYLADLSRLGLTIGKVPCPVGTGTTDSRQRAAMSLEEASNLSSANIVVGQVDSCGLSKLVAARRIKWIAASSSSMAESMQPRASSLRARARAL